MITATADTNIFVSALQFGGVPRQFLKLAGAGSFQLCTSDVLLEELQGVLLRKFAWTSIMLHDVEARLLSFVTLVHPAQTLRVIEADSDDDRVLECAVAAGSQYIVTGDKHLLKLGS